MIDCKVFDLFIIDCIIIMIFMNKIKWFDFYELIFIRKVNIYFFKVRYICMCLRKVVFNFKFNYVIYIDMWLFYVE